MLTLLAICLAAPAGARSLEVRIARVELGPATLRDVRVQLRIAQEGSGTAAVEVDANRLDAPVLGIALRELRWRCDLGATRASAVSTSDWQCEGPAQVRGGRGLRLSAEQGPDALRFRLATADGHVDAALPGDGRPVTLEISALPLEWLQPLLERAWSEARFTAGRFDAALELATEAKRSRIAGRIALHAAGLDSSDGRIATAGLSLSGPVRLQLGEGRSEVEADLGLRGGEVLLGPVYLALPSSTAVTLGLGLRGGADGSWEVHRLRWNDPEVLRLDAGATLVPAAVNWLSRLRLDVESPALDRARGRYLDSLLGTLGLPAASLSGAARLSVDMVGGGLQHVAAGLEQVRIDAGDGRFAASGLQGGFQWQRHGAAPDTELSWSSARMHDIALGAASIPLSSVDGRISTRGPVAVPLLGGRIEAERFAWSPPLGGDDARLDLALVLRDLDLAALSRALDWPPFEGRLSGRIPAVRYADRRLDFDGGLGIGVFDGRVDIARLSMERPFGVAPTLAADIRLQDLDLQPLTAAFGFGEISGRLEGHILGLRLVDWEPVAFDADLHTVENARGARRISQRAVQDLTSVGGGGFVAGLQGQVLRVFDSFGYARIGLRCRLENDVCRVWGVDSSGAGYTIVEGAGLPRVTVVGHQRQVDWPVLLDRLKAATRGQTPVVQ